MNGRQQNILDIVIREYVDTSEPVGSLAIVDKYGLEISPATIRAEMAFLEKEGYIYQPHISAGRVPTDKGYRWFVKNYKDKKEEDSFKLSERERQALKKILYSFSDTERTVKMAARLLSEMTHCGALATLSSSEIYYHGITNIFRQPEFEDRFKMLGFADLLDNISEFLSEIPSVEAEIIYIGDESPYLQKAGCSVIMSPYNIDGEEGLLGLFGPTRMSYEKNISILDFVNESLKDKKGV